MNPKWIQHAHVVSRSSSEKSPVLSPADIEQFRAHGFVHLTGCFDTLPGSLAHRWVAETWIRNGLPPDDRSKWPIGKIGMPNTENVVVREFSPKAYAAICELCGGEDRVRPTDTWGNGMIANYGLGRDQPWVPPAPETQGWHIDGDHFLHFLDSADQGLLIVVLWADVHPQGGGTFIICDSVDPVARFLAVHPEGVYPGAQGTRFPMKELVASCHDFRETSGKAGDVFLLHPFMIHTSSFNHRPEARFMTNPPVSLREPMRLDRRADGSPYSVVEEVILSALGVDHFDFTPTAPRQKIIPLRVAQQQELAEKEKERLAAAN